MWCVSIGMVLHPLWNYLLVTKEQANLGIVGTGIAGVITDSLIFASLLIYTNRVDRLKEGNLWPDRRSFTDLGEYMSLGIQSFFMRALDGWMGSIIMFTTGYLSVGE